MHGTSKVECGKLRLHYSKNLSIFRFFPKYVREGRKDYKVTPCSWEQYTSEDPTFKTKLSTLLNDYFRAIENNDSNGRKDCTFQVVGLMQLRVQFGQMKNEGRLA
jgi:hypothetical protein